MTSPFACVDHQALTSLVRSYPLGWLVSHDAATSHSTPVPLVLESDAHGAPVALIGHLARSNPHAAAIERHSDAVILFSGPQGYISPTMVAKPDWAPTWNYTVARFHVRIRLVQDGADAAIRLLARQLEGEGPDAWTPDRVGDRRAALVRHVIAFRAEVLSVDATFKLGQDEGPESFRDIVASHGDPVLTEWMQRYRTEA